MDKRESEMKPWLVAPAANAERTAAYTDWMGRAGIAYRVADRSSGIRPGDFAALLLLGGGDVDPREYGEERDVHTSLVRRARDRSELVRIGDFLSAGCPVFGICRGLQILNVALGGRLIQHLPAGVVERHRADRDVRHGLRPVAETRLGAALADVGEVNSSHHQALDPSALGPGLTVAAWSDDGVIEAVEGKIASTPVSAVQWHPERMPAGHGASDKVLAVWLSVAGSVLRS